MDPRAHDVSCDGLSEIVKVTVQLDPEFGFAGIRVAGLNLFRESGSKTGLGQGFPEVENSR